MCKSLIETDANFRRQLLDRYATYTLEDNAKAVQLDRVMLSMAGRDPNTAGGIPGESPAGRRSGRGHGRGAEAVQQPPAPRTAGRAAHVRGNATPRQAAPRGKDQAGPSRATQGAAAAPSSQSSARARLVELVANEEATPTQMVLFEDNIQNDRPFQELVLAQIRVYHSTSSPKKALKLRTVMTQLWIEKKVRELSVATGGGAGGGSGRGQGRGQGQVQGQAAEYHGGQSSSSLAGRAAQAPGGMVRTLSDLLESSRPEHLG